MRRGQRQSGGADSTNIQAGRDVVVHEGITVDEVRQIALDVFSANFLKLRDVAEDVARGRAEKITFDFLEQLQQRQPNGLKSAQDPDMLRAIFSAQESYACSGDEDLRQALVDLLVDRAGQQDRDIKTIVLNEAIATIPKLTADQRRAVTVCFFIRYTRFGDPPRDLSDFYSYLERNLAPFADKLPTNKSAYQHIEYTGAASIIATRPTKIENILAHSSSGFFTRGFSREQVPEELRAYLDDQNVFVPCLRDENSLQVNAGGPEDIKDLIQDDNLSKALQLLSGLGKMWDPEVKTDIIDKIPALAPLFDAWNGSDIKSMHLTTIGFAIGHAYRRHVVKDELADLSIWL